MRVPPDEEAAHGDVDHGDGHVDATLVVTHEASPADHPTEAALDDPTAGQDLEPCLPFVATDDLQDEVEIGGLVHQLQPIIGAVGEEVLDPRPALADGVKDRLRSGAVRDVGGRQTNHQEPSVGVDRDVPLASDDLLARVVIPTALIFDRYEPSLAFRWM